MKVPNEPIKQGLMVFFGNTDDEQIEYAMKEKLDVISAIKEEAMSDDENESFNLLNYYRSASDEQRSVMDCVLVCICGWTMNTIIEKSEPIEDAEDQFDWLD